MPKKQEYHEVDSTDKEPFIHNASSKPVEVDSYDNEETQFRTCGENTKIMGDAGEVENPLHKGDKKGSEFKNPIDKNRPNTPSVDHASDESFKEPQGESSEGKGE